MEIFLIFIFSIINMKDKILQVLNISIFGILYYIIFLQYKSVTLLKSSQTKIISSLFLFAIALSMFTFIHETESIKCSPLGCSLDKNKEIYKESSLSPACLEVKRVNWRRAYLLAFIIFVVLNVVSLENISNNFIILLFTWFCLYWYFNFDNYHRFNLACEMENTSAAAAQSKYKV